MKNHWLDKKDEWIVDMIKEGDALDIQHISNAIQNYQVVTKEDPQVTLCPESYRPQKTMHIDLKLKFEAQHDGRSWTPDWKEKCDKRLIEEIMGDLKQKIEEFVASVNPFNIHC